MSKIYEVVFKLSGPWVVFSPQPDTS